MIRPAEMFHCPRQSKEGETYPSHRDPCRGNRLLRHEDSILAKHQDDSHRGIYGHLQLDSAIGFSERLMLVLT